MSERAPRSGKIAGCARLMSRKCSASRFVGKANYLRHGDRFMAIKAGKWEMSDEEFERQYADATRRAKAEMAKGAHAVAARYHKATHRVMVELANGTTLLVPVRLIQGLQEGTPKDLAKIEILGAG